jgi:thiol-disulfide isomerase/thioredoxin
MKIISLLFLIIGLSFHNLYGTSLIITPENPKYSDTIRFNYTPDDRYEDFEGIKLFIYLFNESSTFPTAYEIPLMYNKSTKKLTGSIGLPDSSIVYGLVKIDGKDTYYDVQDDNKGSFWDFLVYGSDNKPMKNAYLKAAISYLGSYPDNIRRNINYSKAIKLLESELNYYPDNIQAKIGLTSTLYDLKKITAPEFEDNIKKFVILDYDKNNENDLRAVTRGLRTINENDKANALEQEFITNHPTSNLAEEALLSKISSAASQEEFTQLTDKFIRRYPASQNREKIFSAIVSSYLQMSKLNELIDYLATVENVPPNVYNQIASNLENKDNIFPGKSKDEKIKEAIKLYNKYLKIIVENGFLGTRFENKPIYYTNTEWKFDNELSRGGFAQAGGDLYLVAKDTFSAKSLYEQALKILDYNANNSLYEELIEISLMHKNDKDALKYSELAVTSSNSSKTIDNNFELIYKKMNPDTFQNFPNVLDSLEKIAKDKRVKILKYEKMDMKPVNGVFETLDGRVFDFSDLENKVTAINFWSTWCGPCQILMPAFEELYYKYKENPNVYLITINVWEKGKNREKDITDFLKKKDLDFPVFYDQYDLIPRKIGINGLPSTVVIDKNGYIQFIESGFTNSKDFKQLIEDRLDYLLIEK